MDATPTKVAHVVIELANLQVVSKKQAAPELVNEHVAAVV